MKTLSNFQDRKLVHPNAQFLFVEKIRDRTQPSYTQVGRPVEARDFRLKLHTCV